jgi:hypothetical protein
MAHPAAGRERESARMSARRTAAAPSVSLLDGHLGIAWDLVATGSAGARRWRLLVHGKAAATATSPESGVLCSLPVPSGASRSPHPAWRVTVHLRGGPSTDAAVVPWDLGRVGWCPQPDRPGAVDLCPAPVIGGWPAAGARSSVERDQLWAFATVEVGGRAVQPLAPVPVERTSVAMPRLVVAAVTGAAGRTVQVSLGPGNAPCTVAELRTCLRHARSVLASCAGVVHRATVGSLEGTLDLLAGMRATTTVDVAAGGALILDGAPCRVMVLGPPGSMVRLLIAGGATPRGLAVTTGPEGATELRLLGDQPATAPVQHVVELGRGEPWIADFAPLVTFV